MAGIKISNLPAIATPATTDVFAVVQSGVTYQETIAQLGTIISSNITANSVTNAMLAQMGAYTIKGNNTAGTANAADLAAGQFPATHTNDDAAAGNIGEFISATVLVGAAVPLVTTVSDNITSISLTAGDWDVWGFGATSPAAGTESQAVRFAINTTSATIPTPSPNNAFVGFDNMPANPDQVWALSTGPCRQSLSGTTTVYLVTKCSFTVSTMAAYGWIAARRVR